MTLYQRGLIVGAEAPPQKTGHGAGSIIAVLGITAFILVTSPGGKHYIRHGRLPQ